MERLRTPTCPPRSDIQALESFTTESLTAELNRRIDSAQLDSTAGHSRLDRPLIMTPEYYHMEMEEMVNLSTTAFLTTVSQYREPADNHPVSDAINEIIADACRKYRNKMNLVLTNALSQYTVYKHPLAINCYLRLQKREVAYIEEMHNMETLAAIEAVSARRNTSVPDEEAPREC